MGHQQEMCQCVASELDQYLPLLQKQISHSCQSGQITSCIVINNTTFCCYHGDKTNTADCFQEIMMHSLNIDMFEFKNVKTKLK